MSTDTEILHLKTQFERLQAQLEKGAENGGITKKSFVEIRSKIRKQAKDKGIDADLVAPLDKKPAKKVEKEIGAIAVEGMLDAVLEAIGAANESISIASITVDPEIQQRASHVDLALRAEYAEAMKAGAKFPPITVFEDGGDRWVADGFHRIGAAENAGLTEILAEIREGDRRDALLYAVGANAEHGARRTTQDKTRAVETLLADAEWSARSDRWIAETAKVSPTFVGRVRESLAVKTTVHVDSQIDEPREEASAPTKKPAPARQGKDGRTTNTSNIGKKSTTKSTLASTTKPKGPTAVDAQQAIHRFGGVCQELRAVEPALVEHEIFRICELARDTLMHFLSVLPDKDRTAMVEKITAVGGSNGTR